MFVVIKRIVKALQRKDYFLPNGEQIPTDAVFWMSDNEYLSYRYQTKRFIENQTAKLGQVIAVRRVHLTFELRQSSRKEKSKSYYLGFIIERDIHDSAKREKFWQRIEFKLDALEVPPKNRSAIVAKIEKTVPRLGENKEDFGSCGGERKEIPESGILNRYPLQISKPKTDEVLFDKTEWNNLNIRYSQDEIIQIISDKIANLPFPLKRISKEEAGADFQRLQKLETGKLILTGKTYSKSEYAFALSNIYINTSLIGNLSSDCFQQENRLHCDSINAPSPFRIWENEKLRKNTLKNLFTSKTIQIDENRLRKAIAQRNYIASQFRPSAAKAIYNYFKSKKVLDFCAGWGDRLAGFSACENTKLYVGVDPNFALHPKYQEQVEFYNVNKEYKFYQTCAEEMMYDHTFDTIFTSPPRLDVERYSNDEAQSWKRYDCVNKHGEKDFQAIDWIDNFLCKAIKNAWQALEKNGVLAINLADVYAHHRWNRICDRMNRFIENLPNAKYEGAIGYRLASRPNTATSQSRSDLKIKISSPSGKIYVEPIFIWRKG